MLDTKPRGCYDGTVDTFDSQRWADHEIDKVLTNRF